jgi:hypothetical protein
MMMDGLDQNEGVAVGAAVGVSRFVNEEGKSVSS